MDRFDPFVKYADVYGDIINWEKDPMNKPQNQNKYFFSDGKTYYEQICKMLRLMSVFKEAFNQIYSNEDEISEAWENFVNNLSASVVEGSKPDVTLTWTDDSVNFEFTMVPGVPGEQGVGITSISFNSDYTMTITLSDGNTYTSMSLKGETGPQGPQGETGSGLQILDVYATLADLQSAHPTGQPGDAYQVGSAGNYTLYIWSSSQSAWVPAGSLGTVSPSVSNPLMDGTASAGSSNLYSRGDHVHPSDTSRASKEELDALIKTSQSLIDQSFTYRESPAIQDGLARIDKIKGNTLKWNQLVQNGNFADTSGWSATRVTLSASNNELTATVSEASTGRGQRVFKDLGINDEHKRLYSVEMKATSGKTLAMGINTQNTAGYNTLASATATGNWQKLQAITTLNQPFIMFGLNNDTSIGDSYQVRNVQVFDLTEMFGAGNEPATIDEFTSLFPLPFYQFEQGKLLSFNGTGLKTAGKNLINANESYTFNPTITPIPVYLEANKAYTVSFECNVAGLSLDTQFRSADNQMIIDRPRDTVTGQRMSVTMTPTEPVYGLRFYVNGQITVSNIQIEYGSTATSYEPYKESSLALPIYQYFPAGMKSAGTAYDELTPAKSVKRIGVADLGTFTWTMYSVSQGNLFRSPNLNSIGYALQYDSTNLLCAKYQTVKSSLRTDKSISVGSNNCADIIDSSFSDANAFKNAMNGVLLYFELDAPVETAIDLDLSFQSYLDGTEQLLPVNGSVTSTSPIIADVTYLSIDDAMEYIIDKLANVPQNTQQILESLEDDVTDLQEDVGALQPAVSGLQTSVGNINTNIGQISSTVAGHTASISDMQSDITDLNTDLGNLSDTVTDHTSRIGTLETGLSATNGNVQSLSSQVQSIDGRVTNLESDLFKIVVKEFDYETVAPETNFGTTTPITQEEGYRIIGVVGTEAQAGEYTSPASNIAVTQCHVHYTSLGALTITIFGRNNGASSRTNVRIYAYLLCIKDIQ